MDNFYQLAQHFIALIQGVSLRLMHKSAVTNVYKNLEVNEEFKARFKDEYIFRTFLALLGCSRLPTCIGGHSPDQIRIIKNFADGEAWELKSEWIWISLPSNPNPYHRKVVRDKYIKALCRLYHLKSLAAFEDSQELEFSCITGMMEFLIDLRAPEGYLIGGAAWKDHLNKAITNAKINSAVVNLIECRNTLSPDPTTLIAEELELLAHHRIPLTKERLDEKCVSIISIYTHLDTLYNNFKKTICSLSRAEQISIIKGVAFLSSKAVDYQTYEYLKCGKTLIVNFSVSAERALVMEMSLSGETPTRRMWLKDIMNAELFKRRIIVEKNSDNGDSSFLENALNYHFARFAEGNFAKRNTREAEYLLELQELLYKEKATGGETQDELLETIISKAVNFLSADTGSYMNYQASDQKLLLAAIPKRSRTMWGDEENIKRIKAEIESWAIPEERKYSSSYRAIDDRKPIYIVDYEKDKNDKPIKQIFNNISVQSCITVPVLFHGRPLGVINLDGFVKEQFREFDYILINEFADDIAPYIYDNNFLNLLAEITNIALDNEMPERKKLNGICRLVTDMFFCAGASIWYKDAVEHGRYNLEGYYNLMLIEHPKIEDYSFRSGQGIGGEAVATNRVRYVTKIDDHDKIIYKRNLLENKFTSLIHAPIIIPGEKIPVGSLAIYDRKMKKEHLINSIPLLEVIRVFLGLAVSTVMVLRSGERLIRNLAAHELGQIITSIETGVRGLQDQMSDVKDLINTIQSHQIDVIDKTRSRRIPAVEKINLLISDIMSNIQTAHRVKRALTSDDVLEKLFNRDSPYKNIVSALMHDNKTTISMRELLNEILHGKKRDLSRKRLRFNVSGRNFNIAWHKNAVSRVLGNLIDNAIKYSHKADVNSDEHFTIIAAMAGDFYVNEVRITNFGIPIMEEDWDNIFTERFRTVQARSLHIKSEGLGLTISKILAEQWGGNIRTVESVLVDPSRNLYKTTFVVVFPHDMEVS